jgi:hypothetical protein
MRDMAESLKGRHCIQDVDKGKAVKLLLSLFLDSTPHQEGVLGEWRYSSIHY